MTASSIIIPSLAGAASHGHAHSRGSRLAERLEGSEILRIAGQIRAMRAKGDVVCNLTVGDFDPREFPIPRALAEYVREAVAQGETNYPPGEGMPALRSAIRDFYKTELGLDYPVESILVTSGARPGIFGTYQTVVDPGDGVAYGVPSWNNNHYCALVGAKPIPIVADPGNDFFPTAAELRGLIGKARLLVINSPLNPTGTAIGANALGEICDLVLEENERRAGRERPVCLLYDQVYHRLTFGGRRHVDPVSVRPAMRAYTIYVDAISKAFAATGLRVGWVVAPEDIARPMSNIFAHAGTWAPRAEQVAAARLLQEPATMNAYGTEFVAALRQRLDALFKGLLLMASHGVPIEVIQPAGAIYLSARFAVNGKHVPDGTVLHTNEDIRAYLLRAAGFAVVPFQAFGLMEETGWMRLSVGAVSMQEIEDALPRVAAALGAVT